LERARCAFHGDATVVSQREGRRPWLRDRKNFREILVRKACMFDALIEYALCSADAGRPRDESK